MSADLRRLAANLFGTVAVIGAAVAVVFGLQQVQAVFNGPQVRPTFKLVTPTAAPGPSATPEQADQPDLLPSTPWLYSAEAVPTARRATEPAAPLLAPDFSSASIAEVIDLAQELPAEAVMVYTVRSGGGSLSQYRLPKTMLQTTDARTALALSADQEIIRVAYPPRQPLPDFRPSAACVEQAIQYISGRYQLDPAALSAGTFRLDAHGQWPVPIAADLPDFPPQAESCITQVHQTGTNQLYQVAFSPRGLLVAFAELAFDDSACARLDRRLCEQWGTVQADDQLKVAIWLTPIDHERLYDLIAARYQSTVDPWAADPHRLAEEVEFLAGQAYQARAAPLLLFLEESGVEDADVHRSAPVVTTTLSGKILRTLAEWPDVVRIEFVPEGE